MPCRLQKSLYGLASRPPEPACTGEAHTHRRTCRACRIRRMQCRWVECHRASQSLVRGSRCVHRGAGVAPSHGGARGHRDVALAERVVDDLYVVRRVGEPAKPAWVAGGGGAGNGCKRPFGLPFRLNAIMSPLADVVWVATPPEAMATYCCAVHRVGYGGGIGARRPVCQRKKLITRLRIECQEVSRLAHRGTVIRPPSTGCRCPDSTSRASASARRSLRGRIECGVRPVILRAQWRATPGALTHSPLTKL